MRRPPMRRARAVDLAVLQHLPAEVQAIFGGPSSRRRFLKRSLGGLALLGCGSLLPSGCTKYPKPVPKLFFFTAKEYAITNLLAARVLGVPGLTQGGDGVNVAANIDRLVAGWDAEMQTQLRVALRVVEHGTSLFDLQRKRFTRLSEEEQLQYLSGWTRSTLGARRLVFRGLKVLLAIGFYETEWSGLGYDGPWIGRLEASALAAPEAPVDARQLDRLRA